MGATVDNFVESIPEDLPAIGVVIVVKAPLESIENTALNGAIITIFDADGRRHTSRAAGKILEC